MYTSIDTQALSVKDTGDQAGWIRSQQVRLAYQNSTMALAGSVFCAFVVVLLLWSEVEQRNLIMWLGATAVLTLLRLMLQQQYEREPPKVSYERSEFYRRAFLTSLMLSGLLWGSVAIWLFPEHSIYHQAYLTFVLGGLCAGAVTVFAPLPGAYTTFALPMLLPFAARIWSIGSTEAQLMVGLIVVFSVILIRTAYESRKTLRTALELQVRNAGLTKALHYRATHDSLVDLINHGEFNRRLEQLSTDDSGPPKEYSLIFIDLDLFKDVNDSGGHAAGDALLRAIAGILRERTRAEDTAARVGGDEFALLLEGCPKERAQEVAEAIRKDIAELEVEFDSRKFSVEASIGVSYGRSSVHSATGMLKAADAACYTAKQDGRNQVRMNSANDMFQTTGRFELTQALVRMRSRPA